MDHSLRVKVRSVQLLLLALPLITTLLLLILLQQH